MKTPKLATTGKHRCDNCSATHLAGRLKDIDRLGERVEPGGTMPSGECPNCGALCYPVDKLADHPVRLKNRGLADVFTGHMTQSDSGLLSRVMYESVRASQGAATRHMIVYNVNMGYMVYCGSSTALPKKRWGFSAEFCLVCKLAHLQGFAYIHFDCDGEHYEGLKEFDW